ncbi:DBH-like monooxygenase protein 2 homolog [Pangasianodon hypophthalmus]|uniref:DBH-like monooxygenase protein 2 homolog n=1 Tax=Pangasianodon hypophthalmus TaxID=310915 RepID=UPI0023079FAB|nr:DBH-like monooxygenase protein 2 homolog [Pangasianodon hypophthalmus]
MMSVPALLMLLVWFLGQTSGADVDPTLPFSEYLDSNTNVLLRWGFDVVRDTITFEVTVNTTGWVGFGFSPNGGMAGSDIVIGGVGPGGIYFTDRNAAGNFMPALDQKQDYKVLSLTEANGQTVMKFQRSIKACDENDFSITEMPVKLIYAYGNTDDIGYHKTLRGTKEVNLLSYMPRTSIPDSKYFDLTMTNFTIPALTTYYHCKIMSLPAFDTKHHIYRIEPVIQNKDIVHHLLLYRCPPSVTKPSEERCYSREKETDCFTVVAVWGVGGGAFEFPEVAGLPVGGDGNGTLYRLEVHYNNQYKTAGLVDNSGLRFYYTAQLRQFDAAVLQTGLLVTIGFEYAIPPNATAFLTYGLCDTSYLPQVLSQSPKDLQVFAVILHTHLAGRKVRVGHFRDGEQIDFLALNEHYDFEFQQVTHLGKTKTVKLGDQLLVECTYNTNNRTELTWGGLETHNEMCLAFLYYYPALDLSTCSSLPHKKTLMTEMGAANATDWMNMMKTKVWDNNSVLEYQQTLKRIQQYILVGSLENIVLNTGKIPELKLSPSSSCLRSRAEIQSPGTVILLLGLMLSLILL